MAAISHIFKSLSVCLPGDAHHSCQTKSLRFQKAALHKQPYFHFNAFQQLQNKQELWGFDAKQHRSERFEVAPLLGLHAAPRKYCVGFVSCQCEVHSSWLIQLFYSSPCCALGGCLCDVSQSLTSRWQSITGNLKTCGCGLEHVISQALVQSAELHLKAKSPPCLAFACRQRSSTKQTYLT